MIFEDWFAVGFYIWIEYASNILFKVYICWFPYRLKTRIIRWFIWCTRLQFIHFLVLVICSSLCFWPQLICTTWLKIVESSLFAVNGSSVVYAPYERAFASKYLRSFSWRENLSLLLMNVCVYFISRTMFININSSCQ
jgi:hypothetical protein